MTFDPKIPDAKDKLSKSQADLLANFGQLNTQFAVNHVAFDASTDNGKHKTATFINQAAAPATLADEYAVFAQDDGGDSELYARPQLNAPSYQVTKDGNLFLGLLPVVAVNFDLAGTIQGSALNVSAGNVTIPGSAGSYLITFDTNIAGGNDYFWNVSGFRASGAGPCYSQVKADNTYGNSVKIGSIAVDFMDSGGNLVSDLVRASVVCWRFQ